MIDITKKYWIDYGAITVRCSIMSANVVINLQQKQLFVDDNSPVPGIETYNISDRAKKIFLDQKEEGYLSPTALPDKPETIEALKELEALGYIVFYDMDEPIGHNLTEDELILDEPLEAHSDSDISVFESIPSVTLEELRMKRWSGIADSHVKAGFPRPEMPNYPEKEYGHDWYMFDWDEDEGEL